MLGCGSNVEKVMHLACLALGCGAVKRLWICVKSIAGSYAFTYIWFDASVFYCPRCGGGGMLSVE